MRAVAAGGLVVGVVERQWEAVQRAAAEPCSMYGRRNGHIPWPTPSGTPATAGTVRTPTPGGKRPWADSKFSTATPRLRKPIQTLGPFRRLSRPLDSGQRQPDQHRDDGDDDEQLDEREGAAWGTDGARCMGAVRAKVEV